MPQAQMLQTSYFTYLIKKNIISQKAVFQLCPEKYNTIYSYVHTKQNKKNYRKRTIIKLMMRVSTTTKTTTKNSCESSDNMRPQIQPQMETMWAWQGKSTKIKSLASYTVYKIKHFLVLNNSNTSQISIHTLSTRQTITIV